jgi:hypothetical protein
VRCHTSRRPIEAPALRQPQHRTLEGRAEQLCREVLDVGQLLSALLSKLPRLLGPALHLSPSLLDQLGGDPLSVSAGVHCDRLARKDVGAQSACELQLARALALVDVDSDAHPSAAAALRITERRSRLSTLLSEKRKRGLHCRFREHAAQTTHGQRGLALRLALPLWQRALVWPPVGLDLRALWLRLLRRLLLYPPPLLLYPPPLLLFRQGRRRLLLLLLLQGRLLVSLRPPRGAHGASRGDVAHRHAGLASPRSGREGGRRMELGLGLRLRLKLRLAREERQAGRRNGPHPPRPRGRAPAISLRGSNESIMCIYD